MKPTRTWVLIADGARARILENDGPGHGLHEVAGHEFHGDHQATHEIVDDQQGRSNNSVGFGRGAVPSRSDPHRNLKVSFAHRLADALERSLAQNMYDKLVVVAAPVTLGDLRSALSDHVRAKIIGEVAQDLTKHPNGDIGRHIKNVLIT